MKVVLAKTALVDSLAIAARAASARTAVQSLAGVMLRLENERLELLATDMEVGVRAVVEAKGERDGAAVLPARLLLDVARSLPAGDVALEIEPGGQAMEVTAGTAHFQLRTLPAEDFPQIPDVDGRDAVAVPTATFVEAVTRVTRAASRDETRPHLTGVLVSVSDGQLRMVATDSYRLSVRQAPLEGTNEATFEANVPARTLQELARIAATDAGEMLEIVPLENQVAFRIGTVVLSSRLVEGRFPNYQQLLPETYEHELTVSRGELLEVVRRVALLAQKNAPLRLGFADGALEVSARTPDVGEASETLPVAFTGEALEIGFNPEFLRDGLESVESEEIILKLISSLRPGLLQSHDGSFLYLLMPIRLNV